MPQLPKDIIEPEDSEGNGEEPLSEEQEMAEENADSTQKDPKEMKINFDYKEPTTEENNEQSVAPSDQPQSESQVNAGHEEKTLDDLAEQSPPFNPEASEQKTKPISERLEEEEDTFPIRPVNPHRDESLDEEMPSKVSTSLRDERNKFFLDQSASNKKGGKKYLFILLLLVVAIIAGTVFVLKKPFNANIAQLASSSTPSATKSAAPSPSPVVKTLLDRSKYTIRVLNGTSRTGLAASVSAKLKDLGYQTEKTANATNSAFPQTVVRVKTSAASNLATQVIDDLKSDFEATTSTPLKSSDTADVEVILGAK